jgi:O-antigen/teichoic acid export membrane protein
LTLTILVASLGLIVGSWGAGVSGWFLSFTRSYRKERNMLVFGLCYVVIGISILGSLFTFLNALERLDIRRDTPQNMAAMCAYTVGFIAVVGSVVRSEVKWRRSVGLGGSTKSSQKSGS